MPVYISLLRAVNLLGHNRISMARLRSLHESLGFTDVKTYIQSGNVVFRCTRRGTASIARSIEKAISNEEGLTVAVTVRTAAELAATIAQNPFAATGSDQTRFLHVAFLTAVPEAALRKALDGDRFAPERFAIRGSEIYLYLPNGVARTKLSTAYFERTLKVTATVRNWKTVCTLHDLASK